MLYVYGNINVGVPANTETKVAKLPAGFGPLMYMRIPVSADSDKVNFASFSTGGEINISCTDSNVHGIYINTSIPLYRATA